MVAFCGAKGDFVLESFLSRGGVYAAKTVVPAGREPHQRARRGVQDMPLYWGRAFLVVGSQPSAILSGSYLPESAKPGGRQGISTPLAQGIDGLKITPSSAHPHPRSCAAGNRSANLPTCSSSRWRTNGVSTSRRSRCGHSPTEPPSAVQSLAGNKSVTRRIPISPVEHTWNRF